MKISIGLSYAPASTSKYQRYTSSLMSAAATLGHELEVIDLSEHPDAIERVDGIVFTGGADVDPIRYHNEAARAQCEDIDEVRDRNEFAFAQRADERRLPIFGICRGLQMLNVHYGGTLIADLPSAGYLPHSKIDAADRRHEVHVEPGTLLKRLTRRTTSEVTSAHHQAIETPAPGMKISARSEADGVVEAIEWDDKEHKPFFLAVQWHPERMDFDEPLAGELFEQFVSETAMHALLAHRM
ncbi:MAG: gamma-glutamyl-gamma-aminobutyrate hydrolase family protein [Bacteroidetes bacterium]|nr:gamma-glutamyl-gamma-aminobutyrate hydrolase family protein [Bacteroidota bacterium]